MFGAGVYEFDFQHGAFGERGSRSFVFQHWACCTNTFGPTFWPSLRLSVWAWKFRPEFDEWVWAMSFARRKTKTTDGEAQSTSSTASRDAPKLFVFRNVICLLASTIAILYAMSCFLICNAYHIVFDHAILHCASLDCRSARISMHARAPTKPDESMNPYESTMNPIQKTDESMNPSYLIRIKNPFFFL